MTTTALMTVRLPAAVFEPEPEPLPVGAYADELDDPKLFNWGKRSTRLGPCGRGCCWTPFAICARSRRCTCHHTFSDDVPEDVPHFKNKDDTE